MNSLLSIARSTARPKINLLKSRRSARAGCRGTARPWRAIVPFTHLAREGRMTVTIGRRELLASLGGAAAWPLAARAQQRERMRRIGVLAALSADDALAQARNAAFLQGLADLGWRVGRNVQIDFRWAGIDTARYPKYAVELVELAPDVILAVGASVV